MAKLSVGRDEATKGEETEPQGLVAKMLLSLSQGSEVAMQKGPIGKSRGGAGSRVSKDTWWQPQWQPEVGMAAGSPSPGSPPRGGGVEGPPARVQAVAWMARLTMQRREVKLYLQQKRNLRLFHPKRPNGLESR